MVIQTRRTGPGSNLPQQKCDAAEGAFVAFASHSKPTGCRLTAAGTRRKLYKYHYILYLQSFENNFSKLSPAGQPTSQPLLLQATVVPMVHSALPGPNDTTDATVPRPRSPLLCPTLPNFDQGLRAPRLKQQVFFGRSWWTGEHDLDEETLPKACS